MDETVAIQKGFITDRLPPIGTKVEVLCSMQGQARPLALVCAWSDNGWIVAGTKRHIEFNVIGWRRSKPR